MSNYEQESLSALMDGEADDLELRRLLKATEQDSELGQQWERFHLAQAVMHDRGVPVSGTFANRVSQALEEEAMHSKKPAFGFSQQLSRFAVAACVAVVAVVVLQPGASPESTPTLVQQTEQTPAAQSSVSVIPASLVAELPARDVDPEAQQRLREYIESMRFDEEEPVRIEHIQESPLYRLVNDLQNSPR